MIKKKRKIAKLKNRKTSFRFKKEKFELFDGVEIRFLNKKKEICIIDYYDIIRINKNSIVVSAVWYNSGRKTYKIKFKDVLEINHVLPF